jgi:tetratricopeptide (TPR) repeat protein
MSPVTRTAPLVAREQTLQELWLQVAASAAQGMRAAVVRGPAGSGKTRVLDAFAERARGAGASVLAGRSPALGGHAYAALADALGAYVRSSAPAAGQIRRAGDALTALVPALAGAEGADPGSHALPDAMGVVQSTYRLVRLITERRPMVLILDDGHLTDADSCEALAAVQRHAADLPWTLIMGWRDPADEIRDSAARLVELLRRERDAVEVTLEPLSVAAVGELVAALLADGLPSPSLVEAMHRRSAGNPYYIEEMVRWLRDSGRLRRVGLQWMAAEDSEGELPPSLEAALRQRSRALPADARTILEWLAVAAAPVELALLTKVSELDPARLAGGLDTLVRAGLIAERGGRRPEYRVHHPLVGECVYRDMSLAHRRLSHQTLARALVGQGEPAAAIATHHVRAADPGDAEALAATLAAAADAESRHHFSQAVSWYAEAVRLSEKDDSVARLAALDRISELGAYAGRGDLALDAVDELLARTPSSDVHRVTLLRRLATLRIISGDIDRGRAAIEEALSLAAGAGAEVAMLLAELTMVAQMTLPVVDILALVARGRAVAQEAGAVPADLVFRAFEAIATTDSGDPRRGLELAMAAAQDAMDAQEFLGFGYNAFAAGIADVVLGRFDHLEESVGSFVEAAEDAGLLWGAAWMWHLLGSSQFYRGDFERALSSFLRSEDTARRHGTTMVMPLPVLMVRQRAVGARPPCRRPGPSRRGAPLDRAAPRPIHGRLVLGGRGDPRGGGLTVRRSGAQLPEHGGRLRASRRCSADRPEAAAGPRTGVGRPGRRGAGGGAPDRDGHRRARHPIRPGDVRRRPGRRPVRDGETQRGRRRGRARPRARRRGRRQLPAGAHPGGARPRAAPLGTACRGPRPPPRGSQPPGGDPGCARA